MKIKQAAKMWWFRYTANRRHEEYFTKMQLSQNIKIGRKLQKNGY